jgi:starch phosphorylase
VSDRDLWEFRRAARVSLVAYVRERLASQDGERIPSSAAAGAIQVFDPDRLTIGFARRFATYKRPNLLLRDPDRLARILTNPGRPVQLLVAGKAHPRDAAGQALVEAWLAFMQRPDVRGHVAFLIDYDMLMAERLVQGIDLWINTPRRPWEACGTSGMKVLVNGGLNLSELDGWWAEAYTPEVGWALGDGRDRGDDPAWDAVEADRLYTLLEEEVGPAFYSRDADGVPRSWVARMRESMVRLTPVFAAGRAVRQYTETAYLPAAAAYRARAADHGRRGAELLAWREVLEQSWDTAAFGRLDVRTEEHQHVFRVHLDLGGLSPDHIRVELYADAERGDSPLRQPMTRVQPVSGGANAFLFTAAVPASRPAGDFTPRLVPVHPAASVPLEAPLVRWYERTAGSGS